MNEFTNAMLSNSILPTLFLLSIIVIIINYFFAPKIIGWFGELWTKQELKKLPKDKYIVINDILIKINNITHQIDHVVISPYGIFSIETKQYNGFIVGNKYDKKWIRYVGKKKYYYTNPIRQNYGHIKSLEQLLRIDESKIYNIVCIPSNVKLKIKHDGEVVRNYEIVDKILSYKNRVIDNPDKFVKIINDNNIKDKNIRKQHINNIKNITKKNINICPKCGGQLAERNGKYGMFIGCSNYPKCKYIKK